MADALDLKSSVLRGVWVQVPPRALGLGLFIQVTGLFLELAISFDTDHVNKKQGRTTSKREKANRLTTCPN